LEPATIMAKDAGKEANKDGVDKPDASKLPAFKKLPKEIQETLDNEEKMWEVLYEPKTKESTDTNIRYAAYASRIRTIMLSAHRYVAYTSDIGESFRPVAHPYLVKAAYAVSWAYIAGDVGYEGYKAYLRNQRIRNPQAHIDTITSSDKLARVQLAPKNLGPRVTAVEEGVLTEVRPGKVPLIEDYRVVMAKRAVFQSIASMGLPAFTIHSIVKYSGRAMKDVRNKTLRTWGPIGLGLAAVPFLPYMFDEPVEKAVEWTFHKGLELVVGPEAVHGQPVTGKKELRHGESRAGAPKEKEF